MKAITGLFLALNISLFLVLGYSVVSHGYRGGGSFSSTELVTIVLTALAVLLTALGIFIAILAILGYAQLRKIALNRAEEAARAEIDKLAPGLVAEQVSTYIGTSTDYGKTAAETDERTGD